MTTSLQLSKVLSVLRLARPCDRLKRARANARARRTPTRLDARTLRDIGITRRQLAVLTVTEDVR